MAFSDSLEPKRAYRDEVRVEAATLRLGVSCYPAHSALGDTVGPLSVVLKLSRRRPCLSENSSSRLMSRPNVNVPLSPLTKRGCTNRCRLTMKPGSP